MAEGYPPDWDARRREVYERDNYQCQNCGATGGPRGDVELHAHHIVPKSKGGTHQTSNLKTLCADCHNAIHGNSMAPSAGTVTEAETEALEFPLDVDDFPYSVATQVRCANALVEVEERLDTLAQDFDDFEEYVEMRVSLHESEVPGRLRERYSGTEADLEASLDELGAAVETIEDVPVDGFSSESLEAYWTVLDEIEECVLRLDEYHAQLSELADADEPGKSAFVDLRLRRQEATDAIESVVTAGEELMSALSDDIDAAIRDVTLDERVQEVMEHATPALPFSDCPICGQQGTITRLGTTSLVRCPECRTEFSNDGTDRIWEVLHSSRDIEGYHLAPFLWERVGERGHATPDRLDSYQAISDQYDSRRRTTTITAALAGVVGTLWAFTTGSLPLFVGLLTAVFLGWYLLVKHLQSTALDRV